MIDASPSARHSRRLPTRRWLFGQHGLRAGWSLALYVATLTALTAAGAALYLWVHPLPDNPPWTPGLIISFELVSLGAGLGATLLLRRIEGRPLATYGIDLPWLFGGRFWEGALWGLLSIGGVIGAMAALGGYEIIGLNVRGSEAVRSLTLWALATLLIGLFEELTFRAAPLFTLSRGIGFWPAALLLSLYFGGVHYFQKPMETWVDFLSVGLLGLWCCFAVRRTGSVSLPIGWHFAYNFGSLAIFGGPNTGNQGHPVAGHLFASSFHGSQYLTGGPMGPEASLLIFPVIGALYLALHLRFRQVRFPRV